MPGIILLLTTAFGFRCFGALGRSGTYGPVVRIAGWLLCMASVSIATSAAGAWISIWPTLIIAIIGGLVDVHPHHRYKLWIGADIVGVMLCAWLAIPSLALVPMLRTMIAVAIVGFGVDWLMLKLPRRVHGFLFAFPIVAFLAIIIVKPDFVTGGTRFLNSRLLVVSLPFLFTDNNASIAREFVSIDNGIDTNSHGEEQFLTQIARTTQIEAPAGEHRSDGQGGMSDDNDLELPLGLGSTTPPISLDRAGTQWSPYLEWELENPNYTGNPYDLIATATFIHADSGETRTTGMFYAGEHTWKFRFSATRTGIWHFKTASEDPDLADHSGMVTISPNPASDLPGFITSDGDKWIKSGTGVAFIPQLVMYAEPEGIYQDLAGIDADIQVFMEEHGFNGFHVPVLCRWFDLTTNNCNAINVADPNPDVRTFEALETLITKTHAAGGMVHLWAWGDDGRGHNPKRWGLNGPADKRLQRYIAARLGPLPGWTMGYGYDLWEWVGEEDLSEWHRYMTAHVGWSHPLGARSYKNQIAQLSESMDYASYEQVRPDYEQYVAAISARPEKPAFSEDRFRILTDTTSERHFTPDETRRFLWQSAMAGGVANIWGNLTEGGSHEAGSAPYPNRRQIQTYALFFAERFTRDVTRCNDLTNGVCLKRPTNAHYIFYREATASIAIDLSAMSGQQHAVAVDTKQPYAEVDLGMLTPTAQTWVAPYASDWAIAVGDFAQQQLVVDTTVPRITSIQVAPDNPGQVVIMFSEPMDPSSVMVIENYRINNAIDVFSATLSANGRMVTLTTSRHRAGSEYVLTVNGVGDQASPFNLIAPDTRVSYRLPPTGNSLPLILVGLLTVIIALVGWFWWRRKAIAAQVRSPR